ncbi:hypothetical protein GGI25_003650 [Coemansia spiralis]|uniref:Vacuolar protein sorting-associated protein 51 homolog n=1 Tax=Coemansia spiralis TaxID=417178 RepID=A0A9W8G6V0_9FUNG|nr:hypothetical protein GGI25_003650 [Coemansia spiralis]
MSRVPMRVDRDRARANLRAFYGIQLQQKQQQKQPPIDTSTFDSKMYLRRLLQETSPRELLQTANKLVAEARQIDNDMKTMVYENYSKFITATETVQRMVEDADFMDAEMEKLSGRINRISTSSISGDVTGQRERIRRLAKEHRLLAKLQFLFDLPEELNRYIGAGRFVEAARVWARTQPLLAHYQGLGIFAGVEKDGKEIMATVENTIWSRWHGTTEIAEGAECAALLVLLRPDSVGRLWREYLNIQGTKHRNLRQRCLEDSYAHSVCHGDLLLPQEHKQHEDGDSVGEKHLPTRQAGDTRLTYFNAHYLPVWNSLVLGFASQFVPPALSGLLDQADTPDKNNGRTMSLLEATTEGTVIGLLSPLSDDPPAARGHAPLVGWQAMAPEEIRTAQHEFARCLREWVAEYEFIVDSLVQLPADPLEDTKPWLQQLDYLVANVDGFPILAKVGGLRDCVHKVVMRWHERLMEGALHGIVRDMVERLEYYFDPNIDGTQEMAATTAIAAAVARRSSVSRHQRNASTGSQASHQRSNSCGITSDAVPPQSPQNPRAGLHARAVSSAFEALSNNTPAASSSPAVGPFGITTNNRISRASVGSSATVARPPHYLSRSSTHRTNTADPLDQDDGRRSFGPRRYRPWLIGSVNRNAPLHVFLADIESWIIQQVLERVNPLVESVSQHYLETSMGELRQSFIRTLDRCLDHWMGDWIPHAFLHASVAQPAHGTASYVEQKTTRDSDYFGLGTIADPVCSLLLARLSVDFELTLTQSIYQLCEHGILSEDRPLSNTSSSVDISLTSVLRTEQQERADSFTNSGRRAIAANKPVLTPRPSGAKWRSIAEKLVRHFVMTVGHDISNLLECPSAPSNSVWLDICRWLKQVEDDTNALFHDPVFSATLKALEVGRFDSPSASREPDRPMANVILDPPNSVHHILSNIDRLFAERVDIFPKSINPLASGKILFHLAMQIVKAALEAVRLRPRVLNSEEFQQVVIDSTFVRAWMLRYTGVEPNLRHPSEPPTIANTIGGQMMFGGEPRGGKKHVLVKQPSSDPPSSGGQHAGSAQDTVSTVVVNERDAQAIQNLVDDWISSAKACAVDSTPPDNELIDRAVFNAWMSAYFGYEVGS